LGSGTAENEGSQVLAGGFDRTTEPWSSRYPHYVCRWLKGFPEAIESVFSENCDPVVYSPSNQKFADLYLIQDRKAVVADLKPIYTAVTEDEALHSLEVFAGKWIRNIRSSRSPGKLNWQKINPMFQFPQEIRRAIYTTNAIESLNYSLRKITKTRAAPSRPKRQL